MDGNMSASRFMATAPFDNGSAMPPYSHPSLPHNQHPQPIPPLNPFGLSNNQRFDANWFANFPPPPPPPPPPFPHAVARSPFDPSSAHIFPQLPFIPTTNVTPPLNTMSRPASLQERPPTPSKERAKDAILSLVRADITYNDLVNEGIKATLLTSLFAELKIPLPKTVPDPVQVLDPAMERKDRIAKLLAAKKSQGSAAASPKESVQSTEAVITPENLSRNHTPVPLAAKAAPRETQISNFSIPGLFLTSAEQEEIQPTLAESTPTDVATSTHKEPPTQKFESVPAVEPSLTTPINKSSTTLFSDTQAPLSDHSSSPSAVVPSEIKSLKRGPEPFSTKVMPLSKRQTSISQDTALINDSAKASDSPTNTIRSKVNQNILKDRMAALKADLMLKNSRKQALQDGMPVLNAEVQKTREHLQDNQSRLRDVRAEIERKSDELVRLREDELRLSEEVQRLERQLEDGETGQQQFSYELTELNDQIMADEKESRVSQTSALTSSPITGQREQIGRSSRSLHEGNVGAYSRAAPPDLLQSQSNEDFAAAADETKDFVETQDESQGADTDYSPEQEDVDRQLNVQAAYTAEQIQANAVALADPLGDDNMTGSHQVSTMTTPYEVESEQDSDDERMSIDEVSDNDSVASASMSDSGSDEYEPPINLDSANELDEKDADDYEPQEAIIEEADTFSGEVENDDYEPSEQVNVLNVANLDSTRHDEDQPITPPPAYQLSDIDSQAHHPPLVADVIAEPRISDVETSLAPTPEKVTEEHSAVTVSEPLSNSRETTSSAPRFVPYSSPLSNTRQFRFNPQFNDVVKNGYRSLTYSHQIDKDVPLCQTELNGSVCFDVDCEEQHFSKFALSDDKILVQMSSANHIKDKAQRDGYLIGLKKVIADLRERGVKEFSEVANALATYRRDQAMSQNGLFA